MGEAGFGGEKVTKERLRNHSRVRGPWQVREPLGRRPNANLLAIQRDCGVAEDKKSDQCDFFAEAMALQYVFLELFTLLQLRGEGSRRDIIANL